VRGLVNALASGDTKHAVQWIALGEQADFDNALDEAHSLGLTISFHVKNFAIASVTTRADEATVKYRGDVTACLDRPGGNDSTDGGGCHSVQSQSGSQKADTFVCLRQKGGWYVSLSNTPQGA